MASISGPRRSNIALSDVERRVATPLGVVKRTRFAKDAEALSARIRAFDAFALVVGLPLNMDGGAGPRVQATRAFLRNFAPPRSPPVIFWDERLSTAAVERALIANDVCARAAPQSSTKWRPPTSFKARSIVSPGSPQVPRVTPALQGQDFARKYALRINTRYESIRSKVSVGRSGQ